MATGTAEAHEDEDFHDSGQASSHESPLLSPSLPENGDSSKSTGPTQKRRRVTRACDECRRKKIKCDGKQPCTHCTVYSYECTYDQPSNRRRNATPQYVEALESQLKRAGAIIKLIIPNADLRDPDLEAKLRRMFYANQSPVRSPPPLGNDGQRPQEEGFSAIDDHLESMVKSTGQLDLDEQGNLEYHGRSSGLSFVRRMREQLGDVMGPEPRSTPFIKSRPLSQVFDSPRSLHDSPSWDLSHPGADLPPRDVARVLCNSAINDAASLLRFVHYPTFLKQIDQIYDTPHESYGNDENAFLPLLFSVLALGTLFSKKDECDLDRLGYENAIDEGFKYFKQSRQLMDIADCRDLRQLQAIIFMILFLQSSAKLSTCYAYIGVALRSALRMGLHRCFSEKFNPIESETRKRVFWVIRKMDTYVGALLGLPHSLDDEDIDQEYPSEVDDEFITEDGIIAMPEGRISVMAAANAHTDLIQILAKIVRYIYPLKAPNMTTSEGETMKSYSVSSAKIQEIERDLQSWQDRLPMGLKPGGEVPVSIIRVQHLLRMAYAHAQMMLYRPFLHYVSQTDKKQSVDKRSYGFAAACVTVSRNIVHIAVEMKKRGLLNGAYWFTMYTTFFAILSLVFYALENPENEASRDALKVAKEGRDTLQSLAKRSMAADRCTATLSALFKQLPEHRVSRQGSLSGKRRRQEHSPYPTPNSVPSQTDSVIDQKLLVIENPQLVSQEESKQSIDLNDFQYSAAPGFLDLTSSNQGTNSATPALSSAYSQQQEPFPESPSIGINSQNFPLADLSAMMFPTGDPFAYPTQPSIPDQSYDDIFKSFGNNSSLQTSSPLGDLGTQQSPSTTDFMPLDSNFLYANSSGAEQNTNPDAVQLLGPMPMYLMQGASSFRPQMEIASGDTTSDLTAPQLTTAQDQLKLYNSSGPRNMNLGQLLGGEEWAGMHADDSTSGMGSFVGPSTTARDEPFTKRETEAPNSLQVDLLTLDNLTPSTLAWGFEGY